MLQAAIKACVDGLETLKADVEKAVNYAVKRLRTSIATLVGCLQVELGRPVA